MELDSQGSMFMWAQCKAVFFSEFCCFSFARACLLFWLFDVCCSGRSVTGSPTVPCNFDVKFVHVLCHLLPSAVEAHSYQPLKKSPNHTNPFYSYLLFCYTFVRFVVVDYCKQDYFGGKL